MSSSDAQSPCPFILNLCSSSDDDDVDLENETCSLVSRKRLHDSSNDDALQPPFKKRKTNSEKEWASQDDEADESEDESEENKQEPAKEADRLLILSIMLMESREKSQKKNDTVDDEDITIAEKNEFSLSLEQIYTYTDDHFDELTKDENGISGTMQGRSTNREYAVSITELNHDDGLKGCCSCPSWHNWCKHIAALGLAYVEDPDAFD